MLDYLKKGSNLAPFLILALLLNISILYATTTDSENKIIFRELSYYIINNEWNFEDKSFSKESNGLEQIFKKYNIDAKDYFIAVMSLYSEKYDFYVIRVFVISKGVTHLWIGKWVLMEGENITEEIEKRKRKDVERL